MAATRPGCRDRTAMWWPAPSSPTGGTAPPWPVGTCLASGYGGRYQGTVTRTVLVVDRASLAGGGPAQTGRWGRGLTAAVAVGALAAAAFFGTDRWLARDAEQQAANHWDGFRRCLLGAPLAPGERPSKRLQGISLALADRGPSRRRAQWLAPCLPSAVLLDRTLDRPALRSDFAEVPTAQEIVKAEATAEQRGAALDELWTALMATDLPLPDESVPAPPAAGPPAPAKPVLRSRSLRFVGSAADGGRWQVQPKLGARDQLRLLWTSRREALSCELDATESTPSGSAIDCRPLAWLAPGARGTARLCESAVDGAGLVYARWSDGADGIFDAWSGQRIWRPRSAAQAFLRRDGEALILYGVPRQGEPSRGSSAPALDAEGIDHVRLVRLRPGKAPQNRRLGEPAGARFLLLDDELLSWHTQPTRDVLRYRSLIGDDSPVGPVRSVGALPAGATLAGACSTSRGTALLFAGPAVAGERRYALAFRGSESPTPPIPLGRGGPSTVLGCHGSVATVAAWSPELAITAWRCTPNRCTTVHAQPLDQVAQRAEEAVVVALEDRLVVAWRSAEAGLRLRIAKAADLQRTSEVVLLAPAACRHLRIRSLQLVLPRHRPVLFIGAEQRGVAAVRVEPDGSASTLDVHPPS